MIAALAATIVAQRSAFTAKLPLSLTIRKDRLKRVITLLKDNADAFAKALSDDFGHRSRD